MHRLITRAATAVAVGAVMSTIGIAGARTAGASTAGASTAGASTAGGSGNLWLARYNGPGNGDDSATALVISPNGKTLYVTGHSQGAHSGEDYVTVAYAAATGARRWLARYNGPGNGDDSATALAISPNGKTLYVTGTSSGEYATVAYNAATGVKQWAARHHGPVAGGLSSAVAIRVSPDYSKVFVTGTTEYGDDPTCADRAYDTVAYSAATGAPLWNVQVCGFASASALAVSPDGKRVYVTGQWDAECGDCMLYDTLAYNAATGATAWSRMYGVQSAQAGGGSAIAVSPDGAQVYVTGSVTRASGGTDYGTIAYSAAGRRLWVRRYSTPGPFSYTNLARSLTVSPAGTVVVTGYRPTTAGHFEFATVAYSQAGRQLWVRLHNGPVNGNDGANSVAAPGNGKVYVTGTIQTAKSGLDWLTIAYNLATGQQLWTRQYNGRANGDDHAIALAARGGRVFVTGDSLGKGLDYVTIAYQG